MARPKNPVPAYKHHKPTNSARCWIDGRWVPLGRFNSPESKAEYERICAIHRVGSSSSAITNRLAEPSINEVLLAFWTFAEKHYRKPTGEPTTELNEYGYALRPLRELFGTTRAAAFGPLALQTVRNRMIELGWCRTRVNKQVGRVRRAFRWAASQELIPATTVHALSTMSGLQRGRCDAHDTEAVTPADPAAVEAVLPFLTPTVKVMVQLQRFSGCRPSEVRLMRAGDLDCSRDPWMYRPSIHKMAYLGRDRTIPLGPRAKTVLEEFLRDGRPIPNGVGMLDVTKAPARIAMAKAYHVAGRLDEAKMLRDLACPIVIVTGRVLHPEWFLFSPAQAREERFAAMRAERKSKVQPSQQCRRKRAVELERHVGDVFTGDGYASTIRRACVRAGVAAWKPNQLRHLRATEIRAMYGLEAAQVVLGHAKADVTQHYAERDQSLAAKVAAEIG
jgi:integrase